jgi:hypothetical protein
MSENEDFIEFKGITYINHDAEDADLIHELPDEMRAFYMEINGLVAYNGGFQIRQCGTSPSWNSLDDAWKGPNAFHKIYANVKEDDIPFAQDCLGDQYIYRSGSVWHLLTETGELDDLELDFDEFIDEVTEDPVEFLSLYPLLEFLDAGNELEPGELLSPSVPFTVESDEEYSLTVEPVEKRLKWLAEYYSKNNK